jgi:hypothetical protein
MECPPPAVVLLSEEEDTLNVSAALEEISRLNEVKFPETLEGSRAQNRAEKYGTVLD